MEPLAVVYLNGGGVANSGVGGDGGGVTDSVGGDAGGDVGGIGGDAVMGEIDL